MNFQIGDIIGYIFAQPGNDTTFLLVESINFDKAMCWDLTFNRPVEIEIARVKQLGADPLDPYPMWKVSDEWLDRNEQIRKLADERRRTIKA